MNQHTPGPWRVRKGFSDRCEVYPKRKVAFGKPAEICEVSDIYDDWRANAKLIAAAPDLLAACEELVSDLFMQIENAHGPQIASKYPSIVEARAAIAKAKGNAP